MATSKNNNKPTADQPLTANTMLELLQTSEYKSLVMKAVQPMFSVYNVRISNLEMVVTNQNKQLSAISRELSLLKQTNKSLTHQVDSHDRSEMLCNLIVSSIQGESDVIKQSFIQVTAEKMQVSVKPEEIYMRTIGKPPPGGSVPIERRALIMFTNRWTRNMCYQERLKLKGTSIFFIWRSQQRSGKSF